MSSQFCETMKTAALVKDPYDIMHKVSISVISKNSVHLKVSQYNVTWILLHSKNCVVFNHCLRLKIFEIIVQQSCTPWWISHFLSFKNRKQFILQVFRYHGVGLK
ncbi:hypothetical protein EG68_02260 [Paragonimus skrjabini miyazakii]|uniref:Uncharacterized protein n=1 Tax=Paragonimus skrjabini miyazakii TaxID=59628 RepID=A0A8S9Z5P8_9TREM|nr:hypothetical protein EG68_02260 [Paragonimus skrjabini miyazakii]